ncbi:MAG: hypothetical protein ABI903_17340 [Actinomycetota bacterium]
MAGRFPGAPCTGDRTGTPEQPLEVLLAGLHPASADLARAAMGRMLPEGAALTHLSQAELQEFLWYQLPLKWLAEIRELHEIAWSLADLFTAAGLERYAALCRAPQTHRLLDAWQDNDHEPARNSMKQAIRDSGVDPPDTPLMRWGSVLGAAEQSARKRISQVLEQAIDAGELVPGRRGWKQLAIRITEVSLMMPRLDLRGATLLQAVFRERGSSWAAEHPAVRQDLLSEVLPLLAGEAAVPVTAGAALMPLRWLLERVGDGVTLTRAGWLPKNVVVEANDTFGWFDLLGVTARTETDLPELGALNELARRTRLITRKGGRVSLSAVGRRVLSDPDRLWRMVVADIFSAGTFEGEGAALAAATLLRTNMPVAYPRVEAIVDAGLVGRWRTASGESLEEWSGLDATREFGLLAEVFGWIEQDDDGQNRTWTLTAPGREAALLGLQLQSRTPRSRV